MSRLSNTFVALLNMVLLSQVLGHPLTQGRGLPPTAAFSQGPNWPAMQQDSEGVDKGVKVDSLNMALASNPALIHGYYHTNLATLKDFVSEVKSNIRNEISTLMALDALTSSSSLNDPKLSEKRRFLPAQLIG